MKDIAVSAMEYILKQVRPKFKDSEPILIHLKTNRLEIGVDTHPELERYAQISRRHAKLIKINSEWFIKNLDKMNGVFVNGMKINEWHKLDAGDVIGFGTTDLTDQGFICTFVPRGIDVVKSEPIEIIDLTDDKSNNLLLTSWKQDPDLNNAPPAVECNQLPVNENRNVNDTLLKLTEIKSFVPLVRCDSKYFKWPIDVKPLNFNEVNVSKSFKRSMSESNEKPLSKKIFNGSNCSKYHDEDFGGYSQAEEVIYVSDDDLYFDFNSSQPIKQEQLEEDLDNCLFDELPEENDIIPVFDSCYESIENITKFIQTDHSLPKIKEEKFADSEETFNLAASDEDCNRSMYNSNDYDSDISEHSVILYPSQNVLSMMDNSIPKPKSSLPNANSSQVESLKKKVVNSSSKTILVDPKPIERRPRKIRGREEWFEPKHNCNSPSKVKKNESKVSINKTNHLTPKNSPSKMFGYSKISPFKNQNLKSKSRAILKKKIKSHDKAYLDKKEKLRRIGENKVSQKRESEKPIYSKKVAAPVKKRSEQFGSRSQFLTNLSNDETPKRPKTSSIKTVLNERKHVPLSKSVLTESNKVICNSSQFSKEDISLPSTSGCKITSKPGYPMSAKKFNFEFSDSHMPSFVNQATSYSNRIDPRLVNKPDITSGYQTDQTTSYSNRIDPRLVNKSDITSGYQTASSYNYASRIHQNQSINQKDKPVAVVTSINRLKPASKSDSKSSFDKEMLERILHFNVLHITESKIMKYPPPEVTRDVVDLPPCFDSYESYAAAFSPLLLLEFWKKLVKYSLPIFDSEKVLHKFYMIINSYEIKENLVEYHCESVVNANSATPNEGSLIILEIRAQNKEFYPILGYVSSCQIKDFRPEESSTSVWKRMDKSWTDGGKLCEFSLLAKQRDLKPALNDLMKGNFVLSMKSWWSLAEALQKLKSSPLCENILKPSVQTLSVKYKTFSSFREYSPSQQAIIEGIGTEFERTKCDPKIILLQGPSCTSTKCTIVSLLERLIFGNDKFGKKILVTAPSNADIDEIGFRLIEFNNSKRRTKIDFVRVGSYESMHRSMKPYSLDEKAERKYRHNIKESERRNKELLKKEEKIQFYEQEYRKYPSREKENYIDALIMEHKRIKDKMSSKNNKDQTLKDLKIEILLDSTVILSTLGNCCQSFLMSASDSHSLTFSCCIVDEATECSELEILQPLMFGINRLILVGDHLNSQFALERQYKRSLYERLCSYLLGIRRTDLIFTLTRDFE